MDGLYRTGDTGGPGDGEIINSGEVPWFHVCPICNKQLSGQLSGMFWVDENIGTIFTWDEMDV